MLGAPKVGQLRRLLVERVVFHIVIGFILHQTLSFLVWVLNQTGVSTLNLRLNLGGRFEPLDLIV
jgi:hypothetical protein